LIGIEFYTVKFFLNLSCNIPVEKAARK